MEIKEQETLKALLSGMHNAVIVEAGAHDCETMQKFMAWLPNKPAHYLAIEPDPRNIRLIMEDLTPGVTLVEAALTEHPGRVILNMANNTWSSTVKKPTGHLSFYPDVTFSAGGEVDAVTLDQLMGEYSLPRIDLLWMDIEGAEADAIKGGTKALANTHYIWMEVWKDVAYEGHVLKDDLLGMLPKFRVVREFDNDVLLENTYYETGIVDDLP